MWKEVFQDSWLYKEGVAEGEARAEAKGALNAKRGSVRLALKKMFPAMETPTEIDQVDSPEALNDLFLAILDAQNAEEVRSAVQAALRVN